MKQNNKFSETGKLKAGLTMSFDFVCFKKKHKILLLVNIQLMIHQCASSHSNGNTHTHARMWTN